MLDLVFGWYLICIMSRDLDMETGLSVRKDYATSARLWFV